MIKHSIDERHSIDEVPYPDMLKVLTLGDKKYGLVVRTYSKEQVQVKLPMLGNRLMVNRGWTLFDYREKDGEVKVGWIREISEEQTINK